MKVYCCTWNVGSESPDKDDHMTLDSWLSVTGDKENAADIYAVCLQEVSLSPISWISDEWTEAITNAVCQNGLIRLCRIRQFGIVLLVFVKPFMLPSISQIGDDTIATGIGGILGNKGAAVFRFRLYGKSICITGCHLSAHTENLQKRNEEFHSICENAKFADPDCQSLLDHDYVFWLGDLNYRLCEGVSYEMTVMALEANRLDELRKYDQLLQEQQKRTAFVGFSEGHVTFKPTYKYDKGTSQFDTGRVPSWCDRVLWRTADSNPSAIDIATYTSYPEYSLSDHKPVAAHLEVELKIDAQGARRGVEFANSRDWICYQEALISYSLESYIKPSSWDWIGVYKDGWKHLSDYVTYIWAPSKSSTSGFSVSLDSDYFPEEPGLYQLVYHSSRYKQVLGVSQYFKISKEEFI